MTEKMALLAGVLYPLSAVPQVVKIYGQKDASGLSLLSWAGFALIEIVFLVYGSAHRLKPIIITGALWLVVYGLIIGGIIYYG